MTRSQLFMVLPELPVGQGIDHVPGVATVRAATGRDSAELAAVLGDAFPEEDWDEPVVRSRLLEAEDVAETYVAVSASGDLVGTASARLLPDAYPGAGYLHWVGVSSNARRSGLGRLLSERVLAHFQRLGLERAVLETDDERLPAIRVYLKLGFVPSYRNDDDELRWSHVLPEVLGSRRG
ncbi:MAG: GNAT family N-acetyltransferase [Acidimicrobiales bacterium]